MMSNKNRRPINKKQDLIIFYDSECLICWHKMQKYKKLLPKFSKFVDIQSEHFSPAGYKLDPKLVKKHLHIRYQGKILMGLDAILVLWSLVPETKDLAELAQYPLFRDILHFGYQKFTTIRPFLPKRRRPSCTSGYCEI